MRKIGVLIVVSVIFLGGCVAVRTYTVDKPRVDTDIEGNRGYLYGAPDAYEKKESRLGNTRKISIFEIEIGDSKKDKAVREEIAQEEMTEEAEMSSFSDETVYEGFYVEEIAVDEPKEEFEYYVVQKNDTLQKISKKFYGTTSKWKYIFNYNSVTIKNPNKVYPGMKIKVPSL